MNYFEYNDKRPSLDVIDWPGIEVTEQPLTDTEIEEWTRILNEPFKRFSSSPASQP